MRMTMVFGAVGYGGGAWHRRFWNACFRSLKQDAFFDVYPAQDCMPSACSAQRCLHTRLSEMYQLQRRGYLIDGSLREQAVHLMDRLDHSAEEGASVDTVLNDEGIMVGYRFGDTLASQILRYHLWMGTDPEDETVNDTIERLWAQLPVRRPGM